jgi:hypothetical protein
LSEAWHPIPVPGICERLIEFSIPKDGAVLVVSYDGMYLLRLGLPITVENVTDPDYDPDAWGGYYGGEEWDMIGLYGGDPLLTSPQGEWLELDEENETVSVLVGGETTWTSAFKNFSGDWAAATFSRDGRFIVLGCPYDFDFRVWERASGAAAE